MTSTRQSKLKEDNVNIALKLDDVAYSYTGRRNDKPILQGVSLDVHAGEFVSIMGPSGCGKSTLLNIVAGFEEPSAGTVTNAGKLVDRPGPDRGFVFQKPALYPWMTVRQNTEFGPRARKVSRDVRQRAEAMLAEVGLAGYEDYKTYELSGGMQHRVAIARTLVNEPQILLMDEPFAALDAQTRTEMQALVLDIRRRHNSTVLFVTHDIEEGLLLSDRVVILGHRPARVVEIIDVDLERPRTYDTVATPAFIDLRLKARNLIAQQQALRDSA